MRLARTSSNGLGTLWCVRAVGLEMSMSGVGNSCSGKLQSSKFSGALVSPRSIASVPTVCISLRFWALLQAT